MRVHFLRIEIRILRSKTLLNDLVAGCESLNRYVGLEYDLIQTINFLFSLQKVALNLIDNLLRLLQVLDGHLDG